jgi:hypothetical protein
VVLLPVPPVPAQLSARKVKGKNKIALQLRHVHLEALQRRGVTLQPRVSIPLIRGESRRGFCRGTRASKQETRQEQLLCMRMIRQPGRDERTVD